MANINNLTSSNSYGSSYNLYGSRNVLTGLASGMDTEAMIQNSISGYLMKIQSLQQSQTKIQWKQDAYRNIIDQMNSILQKYTSYTSKTNLSSNSFFTSAVKTAAVGKYASAISAIGSTKSDIQINAVSKLATAARYSVDASDLHFDAVSEAVGGAIDWSAQNKVGQVSGSMTLKYGNQSIELKFDESDNAIDTPQGLMDAITKKLANTTIKAKDGSMVKASSLISVRTSNGKDFTFEVDKSSSNYDGSAVYINSAYGNVSTMLGASGPISSQMSDKVKNNSFSVKDMSALVKEPTMAEYLSGKSVQVTVDGVTKTVKIGDLTNVKLSDEKQAAYDQHKTNIASLNERIAGHKTKLEELSRNIYGYKRDIADLQAQLDNDDAIADDEAAEGKLTAEERAEIQNKINDLQTKLDADQLEYDTTNESLENDSGELANVKQQVTDLIAPEMNEALRGSLQESIDKAFGKDKVRVKIDSDPSKGLRFEVDPGSTVNVSSGVGEALGLGKSGVSNYLNTSNTLKDLIDVSWLNANARIEATEGEIRSTGEGDDIKHYDIDGNRVLQDEDGKWYRVNEDGKFLYSMEINGKRVGQFTEDTTLESVITAINSDPDVGVKLSYSNLTGEFVFTANETGSGGEISFDNALAKMLFGGNENGGDAVGKFESGQDAVVEATVNGKKVTLTRSSNVIEMDGLTVTLQSTFEAENASEAVTFKTSSESDKVVDTIKSFVEDFNALMKSVYESYSTMPLTKSSSTSKSSSRYEPLTDEDKKDMSETAINAYEEKAKTGLLFGDSDLSQLYSKLLSAIQLSGADRIDMESIGLTTTFSNGITQLSLDEDRLRAALDSDPDKVRSVFTKTVEGGSKTNGLIASLKTTLNNYGSTSLGSPGILVGKAGTKLSAVSLMNNNLQKEYDNLEKEIERWQSRMSDKVDYYTRQFTQLEKLMSMMNNQSSMLASLMGGY